MCTAGYAKGTQADNYNYNLLIQDVSIMSRSSIDTATTPPQPPNNPPNNDANPLLYPDYEPTLYGADAVWIADTIEPWLDLPCNPEAHWGHTTGWAGSMGTVDYKSIVEQMMLGWMPCYAPTYSIYKNPTPTAIEDIYGAKAYLASDGVPLDEAVRDIDDSST